MNDHVICSSCGHTTKAGLVDRRGRCPVCRGGPDEEAERSDEEEEKE